MNQVVADFKTRDDVDAIKRDRAALHKAAINLSAGFVVAVFTVITSASFASLIFAGPLTGFVPVGIRMGLVTAVLSGSWSPS